MQKIKTKLEIAFGKKVTIEGKTAKTHVKEINGTGIYLLNAFNFENANVEKVLLKRSGTGITILVTSK